MDIGGIVSVEFFPIVTCIGFSMHRMTSRRKKCHEKNPFFGRD